MRAWGLTRSLAALSALGALLAPSSGCLLNDRRFNTAGDKDALLAGTVTGNPKPKTVSISVTLGGNAGNFPPDVVTCPTTLRMIPSSGDPVVIPLNKDKLDFTLSNAYVRLATLSVPAQSYNKVELELGSGCASRQSLQVTNANGSFNSSSTITTSFLGDFAAADAATLQLKAQAIADQLATVRNNAEVKTAAEATNGSASAGTTTSGGSGGSGSSLTVWCRCDVPTLVPGANFTCANHPGLYNGPTPHFQVVGSYWSDNACTTNIGGRVISGVQAVSFQVPSLGSIGATVITITAGNNCVPDGNGRYVTLPPTPQWETGFCQWQGTQDACVTAGCTAY